MSIGQPLVSVILCNYNYGRFIAQAIESVLNQTHSDFELIIVDDGSTDNSKEVIGSFEDLRIRAIFQDNGGQAAAFNTAFREARGEVIAFLDSDDWWHSEKLERVMSWHRFLKGNYAVLQHGLNVWENGTATPYKLVLPVGDCFAEMRRSGRIDFFVPTSGLVFRKPVLDQVFPIPEEFRISADAYVMRAAFVFGKVHSIPEPLGFYRRHQNSVLGNRGFDHSAFLRESLFPALNRFYRLKGIDHQFESSRPTTSSSSGWPFNSFRRALQVALETVFASRR